MVNQINVIEFLSLARTIPVIDVRSEQEYLQGHVPGAINVPLFNNEERAMVGILYKNSGRESAVLKGLDIVGPKLVNFIKRLNKITNEKKVLVHCWRGGMRSENMAWLFHVAGYNVYVMQGGYKAYRHFIRNELAKPVPIIILGGLTGSGKTDLIHQLGKIGAQVLDLERLACHKGSVFGGFKQPDQPTNEQFENNIFAVWEKLDHVKRVWIEDESRMIGNVNIPEPLFEQMSRAAMIMIVNNQEQRICRLVDEYSIIEEADLRIALLKISEKLGGANTQKAIAALKVGDYQTVAALALSYYDKAYLHAVKKRKNQEIHFLHLNNDEPTEDVNLILETLKLIN